MRGDDYVDGSMGLQDQAVGRSTLVPKRSAYLTCPWVEVLSLIHAPPPSREFSSNMTPQLYVPHSALNTYSYSYSYSYTYSYTKGRD